MPGNQKVCLNVFVKQHGFCKWKSIEKYSQAKLLYISNGLQWNIELAYIFQDNRDKKSISLLVEELYIPVICKPNLINSMIEVTMYFMLVLVWEHFFKHHELKIKIVAVKNNVYFYWLLNQ